MTRNRPFSQAMTPSAPIYIVMRDFGMSGYEAVTQPEQTREGVIRDILEGQVDRVAYVLEVFVREGTSRDITDDIYHAVAARMPKCVAAE